MSDLEDYVKIYSFYDVDIKKNSIFAIEEKSQ